MILSFFFVVCKNRKEHRNIFAKLFAGNVPFLPHTRLSASIHAYIDASWCKCSWKIRINAMQVYVYRLGNEHWALCVRRMLCCDTMRCDENNSKALVQEGEEKQRSCCVFFVMHIAILERLCLWECILHRAVNGYGSRSISLKRYCCTSKVERGRLRATANRRRLQTAV